MTTSAFDFQGSVPVRHVHEGLKPPSRLLWLTEGRWFVEGAFALASAPLLLGAPRGDGHPVLVLPGFLTSDASTALLREYIKRLGYETHGWDLGRNFGGVERMRHALLARLAAIHEGSGRRVSIVGWSLGGVYARMLAVEAPQHVRSVVTLGTPFSRDPRATNISRIYHAITGEGPSEEEYELQHLLPHEFDKIGHDIDVPTTSIYSKLDGIVNWRASLLRTNSRTENVEVIGASHIGLGVNAPVLWAVADRLAQEDGEFAPFARRGPFSLAYARPVRF
jgi:pimeloyl-ACP methyl ester carboxylesterase